MMKFELKTENEKYSKSLSYFLRVFLKIALIIIFCDGVIKLGNISRNFQIQFNCNLLSIEKSKVNFNKLSRLSTLKNKQKIWEFCKQVTK